MLCARACACNLLPALSPNIHLVAADACGAAVLEQDFDQYPGSFAAYTKPMYQADFPRGAARLGADKNATAEKPGNTGYFSSEERGAVGKGQLRTTHPQGASPRQRAA